MTTHREQAVAALADAIPAMIGDELHLAEAALTYLDANPAAKAALGEYACERTHLRIERFEVRPPVDLTGYGDPDPRPVVGEGDEARREGESRDDWLTRVQRQRTAWIDKHGDDPCPECGKRPITESHLVGCSHVQPASTPIVSQDMGTERLDRSLAPTFAKRLLAEVPMCTGCDFAHGWDDHVLGVYDAVLDDRRTLVLDAPAEPMSSEVANNETALRGHVETLLSFVEQYARNGDYEAANAALEARAALAVRDEEEPDG